MIALRQEVNLQTRSARTQQEQNAETLRQLTRVQEMLSEQNDESQESALRPLLKTLIDARDALALADREVRRVRDSIIPMLDSIAAPPSKTETPAPPSPASWWSRWLGRSQSVPVATESVAIADANANHAQRDAAAKRVAQLLDSLITGYTMSLQRLERSLEQVGLEPIECVGLPFDPEQMEVVAVVTESVQPAGEVIEEVRRGYWWKDRIFRYAQVSVAKS